MKRVLIILCMAMSFSGLIAQQSPLLTQYMLNPFILNPAEAGTNNFYQMRIVSRMQWLGFVDAPFTSSISAYGPFSPKRKNMGIGGTIYNDVTGPTSRLGVSGAYAYNIPIGEIYHLSFGLTLGFLQYKFDGSKIANNLPTTPDPVLNGSVKSSFLPDATAGVLFYSTPFQIGLSMDQLFNNSISLADNPDATVTARLTRHVYLFGLYTYVLNRRWSVEGSTLFKAVTPANPQMDFNVRAIYKGMGWFGASVRTSDGISIMGGYIINKRLIAGISYDMSVFSPFRTYSFGSVEFMIGYRFNSMKFR